jgi:DNA repair protein RadA/Sms
MAKQNSQYICQSCGTVHTKWSGKCEGCGEWNTLVEEQVIETPKGLKAGKKSKGLVFAALDAAPDAPPRRETSIGEFDRVLGGGLVPGSAVLIGGDPGIGKSTLLLQAAALLGRKGAVVAYISGEESIAQIQMRARRLDLLTPGVQLAAANSVRDILASLDVGVDVAIIDSVQTMFVDSIDSAPGTVTQVRAVSHELIRHAKRRNMAMLLVGHVTKDGQIAGPRVLEHMVDTVLYFEGDRGHAFRILRAVKNRFGATDEIGVFSMGEQGLRPVDNPSSLFLSQRDQPVSGSVVFAGIEGSRPLLVEIQALVAPSPLATPRRAVVGWDSNRLAMILAVLEARCGVRFSDKEVYLNVAGGLRINEPGADLAAAAALLSALSDKPFDAQAVVFGEIGLSGEIRPVSRAELRLREAGKLGFESAFGVFAEVKQPGLRLHKLTHLSELVSNLCN